jgi:hypothetical protein
VAINYCGSRLITFGVNNPPAVSTNPANTSGMLFGEDLTVTVTYGYEFLFLSTLGFGLTTLQAQTVMKME